MKSTWMFVSLYMLALVCTAGARAQKCEKGANECSGNTLRICTDEGYWSEIPCPGSTECVKGEGGGPACCNGGDGVDPANTSLPGSKKQGGKGKRQGENEVSIAMPQRKDTATGESKEPTSERHDGRPKSHRDAPKASVVTVTQSPKQIDLSTGQTGADGKEIIYSIVLNEGKGVAPNIAQMTVGSSPNPSAPPGSSAAFPTPSPGGAAPGAPTAPGGAPSPAASGTPAGGPAGAGGAPSPAGGGAPSPAPSTGGAPSPTPAAGGAAPTAGGGAPTGGGATPAPTTGAEPAPAPSTGGAPSPTPAAGGAAPAPATGGAPAPATGGAEAGTPTPSPGGTPAPAAGSEGGAPSPAPAGGAEGGAPAPSTGGAEGGTPAAGGGGQALTLEKLKGALKEVGITPKDEYASAVLKAANAHFKDKVILAMFLAQLTHESELAHLEELACAGNKCGGNYGTGVPGKSYHGRGFIQLSWPDNYKKASLALGMGDTLYREPELVAKDVNIAAKTAIWYWDTVVMAAPGVKEKKQFGLTTKAINGPIECKPGPGNEKSKRRYKLYKAISKAMGLTQVASEGGCYTA